MLGRQFMEAMNSDKEMNNYLNVAIKDDETKDTAADKLKKEEARSSLRRIFGDNLRTGFTFGNNYDCLFQSTFGIFTALWHQSELNTEPNKRSSFDGDQLKRLYDNVIEPFKKTNIYQSRSNDKLLRYYNRVITSRYKIGNTLEDHLRLADKLKSRLLIEDAAIHKNFWDILKYDPTKTKTNSKNQTSDKKYNGLQRMLIYFIEHDLNSKYTNIREYENKETGKTEKMTTLQYYESKIKDKCGENFKNDFNTVFGSIEASYRSSFKNVPKSKTDQTKFKKLYPTTIITFKNTYENSIDNLVNYFKNEITETYNLYTVTKDNKIEDIILLDYDETTKAPIKTFINSAINYIRDLISGLDYDNFIFSSMAYRCTCILLIYWFIPIEILQQDTQLQYIFWDVNDPSLLPDGEEFKPEPYAKRDMIGIPLSSSFEDVNIRFTNYDSLYGHVNYKTYMVFNEVFTSIAMNLFPDLINVDHIGGKYDTINGRYDKEKIIRQETNVLYIIRPTKHDHTYTIAKINDELFWCDDVYCDQKTALCFLDGSTKTTDDLGEKIKYDLYNYLNKLQTTSKGFKNPSFIYYQNDDSVYFVHHLFSSNYRNVFRIKISYEEFDKIIASGTTYYSIDDIDNTKTNQIYGQGKSNNVMKTILLILKIITFTLIIVILVVEIVKIYKRRSSIIRDRILRKNTDKNSDKNSED